MKTKLVLFFAVIFLSVSGLSAQNRPQAKPEDMAKRQSEAIAEKVGLDAEMKQKVYDITLKYAKERNSSSETDRDKRREAFAKLQQQQTDEIKALLSEDQQKKYEEYQKEQRNRRGEGNRRNR